VRRALSGNGIEILQAEEHAVTLAVPDASTRLPAIFARLAEAICSCLKTKAHGSVKFANRWELATQKRSLNH
jgi:hypothetical protein